MSVDMTTFNNFRESVANLGGNIAASTLSDAERVRRAKQTFAKKLDGHMAIDLDTCIHCGMCAEACHFYEATQNEKYSPVYKFRLLRRFYRREMSPMRYLYRPFTRDISAADLEEWQELVYDACTNCGRCDMMCPMGINISTLIRVVREGLAAAELVPAELQALQQEQQQENTVFGVGPAQLKALVHDLGTRKINVPLDRPHADVMLLTTAADVLLFGDSLAASARILNKSGANWTICSDAFDATNIGLISGDDAGMKGAIKRIVDKAADLGANTVLLPESGHAYQAMRWESANEIGESLPFEVLSMAEYIAAELKAERLDVTPQSNGASVTYHDPCRLARKSGVMQQPRDVLAALGYDVRETAASGRENYCCGGGCGEYVIKRSAGLRQKAFEIKRREFDATGADSVVAGCANCRINLMTGAENSGWETPVTSLVETVAARLAD
jgi:Fe-S oxidoreductase